MEKHTVEQIVSNKENYRVCGVCTTINLRSNKICVSCEEPLKSDTGIMVYRPGEGSNGAKDKGSLSVFKLYQETFEPHQIMNV